MTELRALIDAIDRDLVALLAQRQSCIDRATTIKLRDGLPARIPSRVEDVLARVEGHAESDGLDVALAQKLWGALIEWSIAREEAGFARAGTRP